MSLPRVAPNTRVQRTRSSASPPHSPLTRSPLGVLTTAGPALIVAGAFLSPITQPAGV